MDLITKLYYQMKTRVLKSNKIHENEQEVILQQKVIILKKSYLLITVCIGTIIYYASLRFFCFFTTCGGGKTARKIQAASIAPMNGQIQ